MLQLFVFGLVAVASARVTHEGSCPELKPVENFNATAYQGVWYKILKTPNEAETGAKCAQAEYTMNGEELKVKNTHVVDGVQEYSEGSVKIENNSGRLHVTLKIGETSLEQALDVLMTDYTNYAIVFNCKYDEKNKKHSDAVWVLSRNKKLEGDAKAAVDKFLKDNSKELDQSKFVENDFSDEACKFTSTSAVKMPVTKQ